VIQCIFTLDYEIYGNGTGSLRDLVLEPTGRLAELFQQYGAPFVLFPEAVEFAKIEEARSDPDAAGVRAQLRELRAAGHEIGLHLHPWWANARYDGGHWRLDWRERNICVLQQDRVETIVSAAIGYLRDALSDPEFTPLSFRSGLWAMQPTEVVSEALVRHGIRIDSSVFRGGRVSELGLDYRRAPVNEALWRFSADVLRPDPDGDLWELPIHTQMVPFWKMLGGKRLKLQKKVPNANHGTPLPRRWPDYVRFRYPRKLDFCRMTFKEMRAAVDLELRRRKFGPEVPTPVVAIGHSKDLVNFADIRQFLDYLRAEGLPVTTFARLMSPQLLHGS